MELIIKPTELCNFACTFCSSTKISDTKSSVLSLDQIFLFLKRFPETSTIIVNGGDPLMMKPEYYWKIIKYLDDHNMKTTLSFTSNLWDFYIRPEKWTELFKHPRIGVTTSFNYGETRIITPGRVYTEELFWKVSDLFLERIGYRPDFISVINDENYESAIDNVKLAKKMDVECKLNYAMASGDEEEPFQLSKIYKTYIEVNKAGLTQWEFNTKQMVKRLKGSLTLCPQNRNCDEGIRCLQPDGDYYSCGAFGDDREYPILFENEVLQKGFETPLQKDHDLSVLKDECYSCPMFKVCNGCRKTIKDMKRSKIVDSHCLLMKSIASDIIELNND